MEENKVNVNVENNSQTEWKERVENFASKYPVSLEYGEEITAYVKENPNLIKEERCLELALLSVLSKKVEGSKGPKFISGGASVIAPTTQPKTIKEAGAQALEYLKRK